MVMSWRAGVFRVNTDTDIINGFKKLHTLYVYCYVDDKVGNSTYVLHMY